MKQHMALIAGLAAVPASAAALVANAPADAPIKGIHHVSVTVSDIDNTIGFYRKAVPYVLVKRHRVSASKFDRTLVGRRKGEVEIALVETPTTFVQLVDFDPEAKAKPSARPVIGPGYTHICFQSPSTDPAVRRFMAAGLANISRFGREDGVDIGGYGVRYAYGRDPDGIMIENESLDFARRSEQVWVSHIANVVHNRDAMLKFYERLLGRKPYRTIEQENRPTLDDVVDIDNISVKGGWFDAYNIDIEVWEYVRPRTPPPAALRKLDEIGYGAIGFEVSDVEVERARLKALGARLAGKPVVIDGWKTQYAYDPEGNLFSIQENVAGARPDTVARFGPLRPTSN
jgi:catechol 2,3-dioxygenase-like lactoylglutathione lyase family enzyme